MPPVYECNDAYSIVAMVGAGLGWSVLPALEVKDILEKDIGLVEMPQKIGMGMSYRLESLPSETQEFVELALAHFARQS